MSYFDEVLVVFIQMSITNRSNLPYILRNSINKDQVECVGYLYARGLTHVRPIIIYGDDDMVFRS